MQQTTSDSTVVHAQHTHLPIEFPPIYRCTLYEEKEIHLETLKSNVHLNSIYCWWDIQGNITQRLCETFHA